MTRHSPQIDVFGSYFPAWMACIVLGIVLTVIVRQVLVALEIDGHLRPAGLVYLSLWAVFALSIRLVFY
jgi:protein AaeX